MFQASLFKMTFTKIILIYFFVKSTLSTQTLIQSQIDLGCHCFYLEIIWKIHGILYYKRNGNPASVLTHFEIFITKICMKVPGIWYKKTLEKTWNLGPKTLRKPGIWYLEKSGNPAIKCMCFPFTLVGSPASPHLSFGLVWHTGHLTHGVWHHTPHNHLVFSYNL